MSDRRARARGVLSATLAFVALTSGVGATATTPPVSAFAGLPPILEAQLSPDGTRAVMLRAIGETYHAVLADFAAGDMRPLMAADPQEFLFNWCRWANDERVVCSIRSYGTRRRSYDTLRGVHLPRYWYQGHQGGSDAPERNRRYQDGRSVFTRLLAVNADGSNQLQLIPEPEGLPGGGPLQWNDHIQDTVVSWVHKDPEHILVQLRRDDPDAPTVYRLNIYNNRMSAVRPPHGAVLRWYADWDGELTLATGYRGTELVAFGMRDNRLQPLNLAVHTGMRAPVVAALVPDGESAYVVANNGHDTRGLYRIDTSSGDVLEALHVDPDYDVDGGDLVIHRTTGRPAVLSYHRDRLTHKWFDEELESQVGRLRRVLPGQPSSIRIVSTDATLRRLIFASEGNGTLPRLYLYDRTSPDDLVLLSEAYPDLERVVEPEPVVYRARDGLSIPAYLTVPPDRGAGERLPTVLLPQSGPWLREVVGRWAGEDLPTAPLPHGVPGLRETQAFDVLSQLLVSRGYAVLQPNSRGSSGYGDRFLDAGFEQWGLAMQDDLIDGLNWLIAQGIADPDRVCIAGGGYGGYAALVAAFKTPERFRCAVSFSGVADLEAMTRRWRTYQLGELAVARVQDGRARRENSPLRQVDRIAVPLLIVHGDVDRSVVVDQSSDLVQALQAAGKPHRYIEQRNGDHFLSLQTHRTQFMEALDEFLGAQLGP